MKTIKNDSYTFKHFDEAVFTLNLIQDEDVFTIELLDLVNDDLLPINLDFTEESVMAWIQDRLIDEERCNCKEILRHLEIKPYDKKKLIELSKCMSLVDAYWIQCPKDRGSYADYNFYDNPLIKKLSNISFDADDYYYVKKKNCSPELTTKIDFRSCWIKERGQIYLIKSSKSKKSIEEPMRLHSEALVYEIAEALGIDCVQSSICMYRKRLSCKQPLFLDKNTGYISADKLIFNDDIDDVMNFCQSLGDEFVKGLKDMLLLDVITCNTGRTLKDFGFLIDNRENKIIGFAPLFNNSTSLFYDGISYDICHYEEYEEENSPVLADSLIEVYEKYLLDTPIERLEKLRGFKFKREGSHILWEDILLELEEYIESRISDLEEMCLKLYCVSQ